MQDPQLETQHSRRAPSALLLLSPPSPTPSTTARPETPASPGYGVAELAHDARNLISALDLYCELLAAPGVLAPGFGDYAADLRRLAGSGATLIAALAGSGSPPVRVSRYPHRGHSVDVGPSAPYRRHLTAAHLPDIALPFIENLGAELTALEAPLRALAGPSVRLEIECAPCAGRLALNSEELLRILFNLVANAVEAMAATPAELRRNAFLRITAQRGGRAANTVVLSVRDNGPGIPPSHLPRIFDAGFSTRPSDDSRDDSPEEPHGLGLTIVAQLVAEAGGAVRAVSPSGLGARFDIELPIVKADPSAAPAREAARSRKKTQMAQLQQISAQIEKEA